MKKSAEKKRKAEVKPGEPRAKAEPLNLGPAPSPTVMSRHIDSMRHRAARGFSFGELESAASVAERRKARGAAARYQEEERLGWERRAPKGMVPEPARLQIHRCLLRGDLLRTRRPDDDGEGHSVHPSIGSCYSSLLFRASWKRYCCAYPAYSPKYSLIEAEILSYWPPESLVRRGDVGVEPLRGLPVEEPWVVPGEDPRHPDVDGERGVLTTREEEDAVRRLPPDPEQGLLA